MLIQCLQCFHMSGHSKDSDCKHNNRIISTNTLLKNKVLSNIPWKDNIKEITLHLCLWIFLKKVKVYVVHFGQICVFILYMTCFPVELTRSYKPKHCSQSGSLISRPPIQRYPIRKTFILCSSISSIPVYVVVVVVEHDTVFLSHQIPSLVKFLRA